MTIHVGALAAAIVFASLTEGSTTTSAAVQQNAVLCFAYDSSLLVPRDAQVRGTQSRRKIVQATIDLGYHHDRALGYAPQREMDCYSETNLDSWAIEKRAGFERWVTTKRRGKRVRYARVRGECGVEVWSSVGRGSCAMILKGSGDLKAFLDIVGSFRAGPCDGAIGISYRDDIPPSAPWCAKVGERPVPGFESQE